EKVKCNSSKCGYPEVHSEYLSGIELRWRPLRCEEASDWYEKTIATHMHSLRCCTHLACNRSPE
ncbi:hypothetical protein A2U01_0066532, partial [Trifolium medium]|nr:hypothetical protein [Trifolium medium]